MAEIDTDGGLSDPSFLTGGGEGDHASNVSGLYVLCMEMFSMRTLLRQNSLLETANCLSSLRIHENCSQVPHETFIPKSSRSSVHCCPAGRRYPFRRYYCSQNGGED